MLRNLKAEMIRTNIKPADIAAFLNVRYATIIDKLNGNYHFSFNDAIKIKNHFFPQMNIEYLFQSFEKESGDDEDESTTTSQFDHSYT
ncbi:XRE family transcriptional regulator [Alkalicoccobacillus gibsonii]|uniref:XRE family transcriptional regulator n=1 Tax=Alkalicoccobacillus gibsonii TaxID=79881 RepID=UPI003F7C04F5